MLVDEDDLAYDGSNVPQRRPLTARERDIICRVLFDVMYVSRDQMLLGEPVNISIFDSVPIRVQEPNFLDVLAEVLSVLNPHEG